MSQIHPDTLAFNAAQSIADQDICRLLMREVSRGLPEAENRVWHAHPVWFLDGNPVVGYSRIKAGMRLFFWSGADFGEPALRPGTGKFKDASICYRSVDEVDLDDVRRWLRKARTVQWNYRDIRKNGCLERIG